MKIIHNLHHSPYGEIDIWRLENATGAYVELSSLGAGLLALGVPDKNGIIENVALGYSDPADYMDDGPCMGKIPGRYANRIDKGHLEIDGITYQLAINNGPNALHGGPTGFQNRIWKSSRLNENTIRFTYTSADGEENYPGQLQVTADYTWTDNNRLILKFTAFTDSPTVVNLTNHAYWNLRGADSGSVLNHLLKLNAQYWLPTDETLIPRGKPAKVDGTPMDFRKFKPLSSDITADFDALKFGKGYDNCWVISEDSDTPRIAAELYEPTSGRKLTLSTTQPGIQVYTGNWLSGSPLNRSGKNYEDYAGVALEAQGFPDSPSRPDFPCQLLRPNEIYEHSIIFDFSISCK